MRGSGDRGSVRVSVYDRYRPQESIRHHLEVLSNEVVADVEELELFGEDVDGHSGWPAKSAAALVVVEDRVETWTVAVEEVLVALAVIETGATQRQVNETLTTVNDK